MSLDSTKRRFSTLQNQVGKAVMHSMYPDDFEYYLIAIELVDSNEKVTDTLIFPVMPDSISIPNTTNSKVAKTAGGIVVNSDVRFVPAEITIQGTFGRKFRFLLKNANELNLSAIKIRTEKNQQFSTTVKTGYGVCKVLESIYTKSLNLDKNGKPYRMFFYNLAFNSNFVVEPMSLAFNQSMQNNMMWNYTLVVKTVAPANEMRVNYTTSIRSLLKADLVQKAGNAILSQVAEELSNLKNKLKGNKVFTSGTRD